MPTLQFVQSYLSINKFPTAVLPDFTLITGPNGAGKSHLLQAIQNGSIATDAAPEQRPGNITSHVRLFDWASMIPQDTGLYSSENIRQERQNLLNHYTSLRQNQSWIEPARAAARSLGFDGDFLNDPGRILTADDAELMKTLHSEEAITVARANIASALAQFDNSVLAHCDENMKAQIGLVMAYAKRPLSSLTERDILSPQIPTWGQADLFQQNFARLFVAYRDLLLSNTIAQFRSSKGHDAQFLTDEEFVEQHGQAPWDFVNSSLRAAGLDFVINSPSLDEYMSFQPTLTKRSSGVPIPFSALSSGEKVLMSFAFCVYYSNDKRQLAARPKVLLLDEIDAPLHPSMSRNIIDTVTKTLVEEFGIKVIATTHSPSTIALAREEAIFTMKPGQPGLHKSSKAAALNILTVGVPTIAISYDGRRQVFVESPTGAKVYDGLYKLIRTKIDSERTLEFIATGTRTAGNGDHNTGCDNVKRIVDSLVAAGNLSVFGLLDWDGKHQASDRIAVLSQGSRNGIENVVFDPLLFALTIARSFPGELVGLGLDANVGYLQFANGDSESFQPVVNQIGERVFGGPAEHTLTSKYLNGLEVQIDTRFATTDDHSLETQIVKAFPFLQSISKQQAGKLLEHVIGVVLTDVGFMPMDVKHVMTELLERSAHPEVKQH